MDKSEFVRACREGGAAIERALRTLDRSFFAALHRECRRVVRDAELARDLVQETFIKVWQRCATFSGEAELLPWIRAILRNGILDRLRRAEHELSMDHDDALSDEVQRRLAELSAERVPRPPDAARAREVRECFARCWRRFELECPAHAAVIAWIVEDGLTGEQIAELLGRSPGATREYISQCRKRARVYFAEWYSLAFAPE